MLMYFGFTSILRIVNGKKKMSLPLFKLFVEMFTTVSPAFPEAGVMLSQTGTLSMLQSTEL